MNGALERVELLLKQQRTEDARQLLESYLDENPQDFRGRYYMAAILLESGEKEDARAMCEHLLMEEPDNYGVLHLAINVDLADDKDQAAEEKAEQLIELYTEDSDAHVLMSRIKLHQRNYDRAIESANRVLELDAENEDAYGIKISIGGLLGEKDTNQTIEDALQVNPENPSLIANKGYQLIRDGKIDEGLDLLKDALSRDPNNQLARFGLMEGLKSKFWPYRMFMKYAEYSAKLSEKGSWTFIIGAYVVYRILGKTAENNPELAPFIYPIVYFILFLFISSWVMTPLMNLYLLMNQYGRLLLDKDDKTMARLVGVAAGSSLVFLAGYLITNIELFSLVALVCFISMIPLGTFLNPVKEKNRKITKAFAIGIPVLGLIGIFSGVIMVYFGALILLFVYQWMLNGIMIRENSRTFG